MSTLKKTFKSGKSSYFYDVFKFSMQYLYTTKTFALVSNYFGDMKLFSDILELFSELRSYIQYKFNLKHTYLTRDGLAHGNVR